jgi:hypothetical protein
MSRALRHVQLFPDKLPEAIERLGRNSGEGRGRDPVRAAVAEPDDTARGMMEKPLHVITR